MRARLSKRTLFCARRRRIAPRAPRTPNGALQPPVSHGPKREMLGRAGRAGPGRARPGRPDRNFLPGCPRGRGNASLPSQPGRFAFPADWRNNHTRQFSWSGPDRGGRPAGSCPIRAAARPAPRTRRRRRTPAVRGRGGAGKRPQMVKLVVPIDHGQTGSPV